MLAPDGHQQHRGLCKHACGGADAEHQQLALIRNWTTEARRGPPDTPPGGRDKTTLSDDGRPGRRPGTLLRVFRTL